MVALSSVGEIAAHSPGRFAGRGLIAGVGEMSNWSWRASIFFVETSRDVLLCNNGDR